MILRNFPPMGVYETLFKFADATGSYMGDAGTHPWAQGFPLTTQVPGGPELPTSIEVDWTDLKYPKASRLLMALNQKNKKYAFKKSHRNQKIKPCI